MAGLIAVLAASLFSAIRRAQVAVAQGKQAKILMQLGKFNGKNWDLIGT
jgi:hypothetical protein